MNREHNFYISAQFILYSYFSNASDFYLINMFTALKRSQFKFLFFGILSFLIKIIDEVRQDAIIDDFSI